MRIRVSTESDGHAIDVTFEVRDGETMALVGPNGAGKTTALMTLAGLHVGTVEMDGDAHPKFGVMFQDAILFPHMTVRQNVSFGAVVEPNPLIERLGLSVIAGRRARDLSGGEAQKVALARTLATSPDFLLLDEPMSALDVSAKTEMRRFLHAHLEEFAGPRIVVTHDPVDAFGLADTIYVMEDGRITQHGGEEDLRERPATSFVADLVGINLLRGHAEHSSVQVGQHHLNVAESGLAGPVYVQIHPRAVAIHQSPPDGSARNVWPTRVEHIEHLEHTARVSVGGPLPLTSEITSESVRNMGLKVGSDIFLAVKATEIEIRRR